MPKICGVTIAQVFDVMFLRMLSISILYVLSMSQNTGVNPLCTIAFVVDTNVNGDVNTSAPLGKSTTAKAASMAE